MEVNREEHRRGKSSRKGHGAGQSWKLPNRVIFNRDVRVPSYLGID